MLKKVLARSGPKAAQGLFSDAFPLWPKVQQIKEAVAAAAADGGGVVTAWQHEGQMVGRYEGKCPPRVIAISNPPLTNGIFADLARNLDAEVAKALASCELQNGERSGGSSGAALATINELKAERGVFLREYRRNLVESNG